MGDTDKNNQVQDVSNALVGASDKYSEEELLKLLDEGKIEREGFIELLKIIKSNLHEVALEKSRLSEVNLTLGKLSRWESTFTYSLVGYRMCLAAIVGAFFLMIFGFGSGNMGCLIACAATLLTAECLMIAISAKAEHQARRNARKLFKNDDEAARKANLGVRELSERLYIGQMLLCSAGVAAAVLIFGIARSDIVGNFVGGQNKLLEIFGFAVLAVILVSIMAYAICTKAYKRGRDQLSCEYSKLLCEYNREFFSEEGHAKEIREVWRYNEIAKKTGLLTAKNLEEAMNFLDASITELSEKLSKQVSKSATAPNVSHDAKPIYPSIQSLLDVQSGNPEYNAHGQDVSYKGEGNSTTLPTVPVSTTPPVVESNHLHQRDQRAPNHSKFAHPHGEYMRDYRSLCVEGDSATSSPSNRVDEVATASVPVGNLVDLS